MNEQQLEIIRSFGVGQAVIAGAGCGKTTTLVAKCIAMVRERPEARFCAVSFTEKSVRDLKSSLKKGFQKEGFDEEYLRNMERKHWIKTIHGLCLSIVQEFPLEAGLHGGERIALQDEAEKWWERSLYLLWTRNENQEVSAAVERLLRLYSRTMLEANFKQLRSLISFGVDSWMEKAMKDRPELRDLWFVFHSVFDRFQQWKMKAGALDFNDLERFAKVALGKENVRKYYHDRFDLVLVDEFQDTNPIQGEILEQLVKPDYSNLCIVGDPKQSIYRFRDADVSVFQDLTLKLPKRHLLDTNYRSVPEIIDFVNQVCAPVFEASSLDYEPLQAGRSSIQPVDEVEEEPRVFKLAIEDERSLAQFLSEEEKKGIDLSEYVILVRSIRREKTQRYLNALDAWQVPYLLGSGGRFYGDPRIRELVAFLRGWVSSNQTLSQATALRAPWIGVKDSDLLAWKDDLFGLFFEKSSHPVALTLREAYLKKTPLRPGEVLEKIWDTLEEGNEMELPLATLWQKAEEFSGRGLRFEEVTNEFVKAIDEDRIEKEVPPPAEKGMVRIMTIHASKGLQFPRVILLDFEGEYRTPSGSNDLIWNRKKGIHLYIRDEKGERDSDHPENEKWASLEKAAAVAESKRLFYVAITRPQQQLILGWKKEVKISKKEPSLDSDNWRTWVELTSADSVVTVEPPLSEAPIKMHETNTSIASAVEVALVQPMSADLKPFRPRHSASEWMILNQCALRYQWKFFSPEPEFSSWGAREEEKEEVDREEKDSSDSTTLGEKVAEKGIRIHAHLEHEDWDALRDEFFAPLLGDQVVEAIQKAVVVEADGWKIYRELAFEVPFPDSPHGDEAFVGMMDRLEVHPETGKIRILDYKWTQATKSADLLRAHYQLQLELYAWTAWKLCKDDFSIQNVEAQLIHLSKDGVEVVPVPMEMNTLEATVSRLLSSARETLAQERLGKHQAPTPGEYCRYCEFRRKCPVFSEK